MKRRIEFELLEGERLSGWEGTVELSAEVRAQLAGLLPMSLVELEGDYQRPDRHTLVLRVSSSPKKVTSPLERALQSLQNTNLLERLVPALAADTSGLARAVCAAHAASRGDLATAEADFLAALRAGVSWEGAPAMVIAWQALSAAGLESALASRTDLGAERTSFLTHVWAASRWRPWPWEFRVNPLVFYGNYFLSGRVEITYPWHFGGPCVDPPREALLPWIEERFAELATSDESHDVRALRNETAQDLAAWVAASEARDQKLEEEAQEDANAQMPADSEDSSPEGVEVSEPLERDQVPATWARFSSRIRSNEEREIARGYTSAVGDLCRLYKERLSADAARAFALALDAAVIVAAVEPTLVMQVRKVVFVSVTLEEGALLLRLRQDWAFLHAPRGAFGPWRLVHGDGEKVLASMPEAMRPLAREAMRVKGEPAAREAIAPVTVRRFPPDPPPPRAFPAAASNAKASAPLVAPPKERFVMHPKFGKGRVMETKVEQGETKLLIDFEGAGRKVLLAQFVQDA